MTGGTTCRMHGGSVRRGVLSPSFKTGRYSRFLDATALQRYHEGLEDPTMLALTDEIALTDVRLSALAEQIGKADVPDWDRIKAGFEQLDAAVKAGDSKGTARALSILRTAIAEGRSERESWSELNGLVHARRRLVESERRRMVEAQQFVAVGQVMGMIAALNDAVRRHVKDREALAAISADIRRLTSPTAN